MNNTAIITRTFTPVSWFEFQKSDNVIEVLDIETAVKIDGYKEIRVTFVMKIS